MSPPPLLAIHPTLMYFSVVDGRYQQPVRYHFL